MKPKQRFCLTLELRDDQELVSDYLYWHEKEHIWPEIPEGIKAVGILQMEIYRMNTRLFMIIEAGPDFEFDRDMKLLSTLPRQAEWETFVSRFQKTGPGETSAEKWMLMNKIFELV
ncbi:MAG: L-rhamnose mutarotase [Bacteroidota bacterium]